TAAQWGKTLDKMHTWGAPTDAEDLATLTAYLAAACGLDAGAFEPEPIRAREAAMLFRPLADPPFGGGDPGRGRSLYAARCAPCHAENGGGGERGTRLVGRQVLDRAAEFAAVVRAGRGRMPEFTEATDAEVADLLAWVRSLPGSR